MRYWKKSISVLCILALLVGMIPTPAYAEMSGTETTYSVAECVKEKKEPCEPPAVSGGGSFSPKTSGDSPDTAWSRLQNQIDSAASGAVITLDGDIIADSEDRHALVFGDNETEKSLTLDLNGHRIDKAQAAGRDQVIVVKAKCSLTIRDSSGGGVITGGRGTTLGGGIYVIFGGSLTLEGGSVEYNSATNGGGIFAEGSLTLAGGSVQNNSATNGGGVYLDRLGQLALSGGSITGNTAAQYGGGVYTSSSNSPTLYGGSITGNSAPEGGGGLYSTQDVAVDNGSAIIVSDNFGSSAEIPSNVFMESGRSFTVRNAPVEGSAIHLSVQQMPTRENPVLIASSRVRCEDCFVVDNQPELTEIVWSNRQIVLRLINDALSWAELQQALNEGGIWDSEKKEYIIRLGMDVSAGGDESALIFNYGDHPVVLDLQGHTINRGLDAAAANGNILTLENGALIIRDSVGGGRLTGGYNNGNGGGIYVGSGAALTVNNVSITENRTELDGGGIYVADGAGDVTVNNAQITYCTALGSGGGIYGGGSDDQQANLVGVLLLVGGIVTFCSGGVGGGIYMNKGRLQLDSGSQIINNTNLKGDMFSNIVFNEAGTASIVFPEAVAAPIAMGLPVAAAAATVPLWIKGIMVAGAALIIAGGLKIYCDWATDQGDQGKPCSHPSWTSVPKWEEEYYSYVDEYNTCNVCGYMEHEKLSPEQSVDSTTQATTYTVVLKDAQEEKRVVNPYIVLASTGIEELSGITESFRVPHRRGMGATFVLPAATWDIEDYVFESWRMGDETVTQVAFEAKPYEDEQIITIEANWKVSITYESSTLLPEKFVVYGEAPQNPNPSLADVGTLHTLLDNHWEQYFVGVDGDGEPILSPYLFTGWDVSVGVKFTDKFTIEYIFETVTGAPGMMPGSIVGPLKAPIKIRAKWKSPWKIMGDSLNNLGSFELPYNIYATQLDATMSLKKTLGQEGKAVLDLNGYKAHAWFLSATMNPITVQRDFLVKDSSDKKTGSISGGKSLSNGAGVVVDKEAVFTLESGSIRDNFNLITHLGEDEDERIIPNAGGVMVKNKCTFVMEGGTVKDNSTPGGGGGVYIDSDGSFQMSGGEIFGNRARYDSVLRETTTDGTGQGGGVYVGGSFSVSGKVVIKDNIVDGKANNVYLPNGKAITVSGKLDEAAEIHVSMEKPGVITSGLNAKDESEARGGAQNFVSDDPAYEVIINFNGEAALRRKVPEFDKTELELGGVLKLRFYMSYPEGWDPTNDRMEFTVNGKQTRTVAYNPGAHGDGKDYFACPVNAYQMADKIQAVYYFHDLEVVRTEYTVKENLEYLKEHSTGSTLELVKATMNYGHYIQPYLAQVNRWTVGVDHLEMPAYGEIVPAGNPASAYGYEFKKTPYYNEYVARTELYLTLDAGTALNVRVFLKDGGTVTAAVNNSSTVPVNYSGNNWVISVPGVPANLLGTQYLFSCSVDGHKVFDFKVSALSYVNIVLGRGTSPMIEQNALTALFDYALAAQKYVNVA